MKYPGAYYLLLLYATFVLQPMILVAEDLLSHIFADATHTATVHEKYGNDHVETELAQTSSNNDSGQNHDSQKSEERTAAHIFTDLFLHQFNLYPFIQQFESLKPDKLSSAFISKQTPPPQKPSHHLKIGFYYQLWRFNNSVAATIRTDY